MNDKNSKFRFQFFRMHYLIAGLSFVIGMVNSIKLDDDFNFQLELIKHQPCNYGAKSKWTRKLEFESGTDKFGPKLDPIPNRANCYTVGGKVQVFEDFRGEFSIYLELRNTASKKQVPESCVKQGPDGCGGFGSCTCYLNMKLNHLFLNYSDSFNEETR
ncbi:hypothetical protein DICVIV_13907 [Dictyocaulus viviparus]|uniref:Uncharacterized protein n=1 Tax=Dictyocaulus viviparus TaxID=29172 RepID=A0A0D8X6L2_DICVI|nr:hypothetical protein DICVIV_13907 [Dictyocaulus viviparus]